MRAALQGGAKASEAAVIYQELGERHNWTVPLYNGAAACAMQLGNWEEAEQYLQANCSPTGPSSERWTSSTASCDLGSNQPGVEGGNILRVSLISGNTEEHACSGAVGRVADMLRL